MSVWLRNNLWRHAVALFMCAFALFPLYLVVISSFSQTGSLQLTSFVPRSISWRNYSLLFTSPAIPYLTWIRNSLVIAGSVAILSVIIGASSAFAFSRLKFRGKKLGIQLLLLVQT
jgi:arabinogalactan oligomer/maltooligosaccharide transport system permease protein